MRFQFVTNLGDTFDLARGALGLLGRERIIREVQVVRAAVAVHLHVGGLVPLALAVFFPHGRWDARTEILLRAAGREDVLTHVLGVVHHFLNLGSVELTNDVTSVRLQMLAIREQVHRDDLIVLGPTQHRGAPSKRVECVVGGLSAWDQMLTVRDLIRPLLLSLLSRVSVLSIARLSQVSHRVGVGRILVSAVNHARFELLNALHTLV